MSLIINFKIYLYTPKVSYPFILSHITYCQNACLFYMKNFKSKYRVYIMYIKNPYKYNTLRAGANSSSCD